MADSGVEFTNPPVKEVNLTVWYEQIDTLNSLHLSSLRIQWLSDLPKVEEKTPLAPWNPADSISFINDKWPMPACIFVAANRDKQILVQNDRFSLTWRFTGSTAYPGFQNLRHEFDAKYQDFLAMLRKSGNPDPTVERVTIDYENYLEYFDTNLVAKSVVNDSPLRFADRGISSENSTAIRKHYCPTDKYPGVTLFVGVDVAPFVDDGEDSEHSESQQFASLLTIMSRANIEKGDDTLQRLQVSHDAAIERFLKLFDDSIRSSWGESNG